MSKEMCREFSMVCRYFDFALDLCIATHNNCTMGKVHARFIFRKLVQPRGMSFAMLVNTCAALSQVLEIVNEVSCFKP